MFHCQEYAKLREAAQSLPTIRICQKIAYGLAAFGILPEGLEIDVDVPDGLPSKVEVLL